MNSTGAQLAPQVYAVHWQSQDTATSLAPQFGPVKSGRSGIPGPASSK